MCMYVYVYVCIHVCMYVCMYVYVYSKYLLVAGAGAEFATTLALRQFSVVYTCALLSQYT